MSTYRAAVVNKIEILIDLRVVYIKFGYLVSLIHLGYWYYVPQFNSRLRLHGMCFG